jgi:hypothetical protein
MTSAVVVDIQRLKDVRLAKEFGYSLCNCHWPPEIMLWRKREKANVCQNCGALG